MPSFENAVLLKVIILISKLSVVFCYYSLIRKGFFRSNTYPSSQSKYSKKTLIVHADVTDKIKTTSNGAWLPFGLIDCLDQKQPTEIIVAGESYVVWKSPLPSLVSTKGWNIMKDACPHRLAPLSQGRVDPETGCIECPYHGWQFASETGST